MSNDELGEVGTLPAKSTPGKLYKPKASGPMSLMAGAITRSKPDLAIPAPDVLSHEKWWPVRMLRNYRPVGDYMLGIEAEGEDPVFEAPADEPKAGDEGFEDYNPGLERQVKIGQLIQLRLSEARAVIGREIAERADAIN